MILAHKIFENKKYDFVKLFTIQQQLYNIINASLQDTFVLYISLFKVNISTHYLFKSIVRTEDDDYIFVHCYQNIYHSLYLTFNPYSAGTDFGRQILTSKIGPHIVRIKIFVMAVDL